MHFYGSLCVFIVLIASLWILIGPYGSLLFLVRLYLFKWVLMDPYRS